MKLEDFEEIIHQLKEFPRKLKLLNFAGWGEPLLHPQIAEMVALAKKEEIAERVEIVTNASMLTPKLSDALVEAGLDRLRISLQGLTAEDYQNVSEYKMDYDAFVEKIRYFYQKSREGNTKVYIKIMDAMIRDEKDEEKFQQLFAGICDSLNIETLVPLVEENDISSMKQEFDTGYWKNEVKEVLVCPQPFYFLLITPEGVVFPCCEIEANVNVGKITKDDTLVGIWNGERMQKIRSMMLSGKRFEHPECKSCNVVTYQTSKEDNLDSYAEELRIKYEKK